MDFDVLKPQLGVWNVELIREVVVFGSLGHDARIDRGLALGPMCVVGGRSSMRFWLLGGDLEEDGTGGEISLRDKSCEVSDSIH